jgi:hypothetical protein
MGGEPSYALLLARLGATLVRATDRRELLRREMVVVRIYVRQGRSTLVAYAYPPRKSGSALYSGVA